MSKLIATALAVVFFVCGMQAEAATRTWTGGAVDQKWSRPANWLEGTAPANGDRVVLRGVGASVNDIPGLTLDGIEFNSSNYVEITGTAFSISGSSAIVLSGSWPLARIGVPVRLSSASPTITALSSVPMLELDRVTLAGGTLSVTGPAQIRFQGPIDEEAPASLRLSGESITLYSANSITGTIESTAKLLTASVGSLGSPGNGTIIGPGSALSIDGPGPCAELITLRGAAIGTSFSLQCPLHLEGTVTFGNGEFQGPISGSGRMKLPQMARVTLSNPANSFAGGVELSGTAATTTLILGASGALPGASELAVHGDFASVELGSTIQRIRRLDCSGRARIVLRPGFGQLGVRERSNISSCRASLEPRDTTWPQGEAVVVRNESGSAFEGEFVGLHESMDVSINGELRFVTYRGGAGYDVSLVPASSVWSVQMIDSPPRTIATSQTIPLLRVRALDRSGNAVPNSSISFSIDEACGTFGGQTRVYAMTDAQGFARTPPVSTAASGFRSCIIGARSTGGGGGAAAFTLYDPSALTINMVPFRMAVEPGTTFEVSAHLKAGLQEHFDLPGMAVTWEVHSISGGAEPTLASGTSVTGDYFPDSARARMIVRADGNPGIYLIVARVGESVGTLRVEQGPTQLLPLRQVTGLAPGGGTISVTLESASASCTFSRAQFPEFREGSLPREFKPEANLAFPYGVMDLQVQDCGTRQPVTFKVEFPGPLPPTWTLMKFGPEINNTGLHWYSMPATVAGAVLTFTVVDEGKGDDDLRANGSIRLAAGVAFPGGVWQDLWWSGPAENGWGMSIIQHRDVLVANVYAYDAQGRPTWFFLPGGSWNAARTAFTGALYLPRGSPFFAYDAGRFDIGAPVGTATLTFSGETNAVFDYTINGVSGRKNITRLQFGRPEMVVAPNVGDLWWGGVVQNGWGITVLQQVRTLFSLWFTYGADGQPTWYVMPGGEWTFSGTYEGRIFRAVGPAWVGVPYDPAPHRTIDVGSYRLYFSGESATFEYNVEGRSGSLPLVRLAF